MATILLNDFSENFQMKYKINHDKLHGSENLHKA